MYNRRMLGGPGKALLIALWFLAGTELLPALSVGDLRCGLRTNPLGIGDATPRLSWQLQAGGAIRGEVQSAYQIQVGSAPGMADLWDSGKVNSDQTVDVLYGGQMLTSGKRCYWRVRVYDGSNSVSSWSTNAFWSMGLLNPGDWSAQWIGYDAAYDLTPQQTADNALLNTSGLSWVSYSGQTGQNDVYQSSLRKKITLPANQTITNAVMALYADNACEVYVNGQAMTNAAYRWEATARIDVTPWLHGGTNVLALSATSSDTQRPATVIGRLVVRFASGSVSNIPVDTSWKAAQWPSGNWTATNYDDSAWTTPSSGGSPWGTPALNDSARVPAPYLRKEFSVSQTVTQATVYVTALGAYELRLNGQKVGNDVLTPGWTDFFKRVYYQAYDVTAMLQTGSNTIGAILGDGWYASNLAFRGQRLNYYGKPRFLAQLVLHLADGSTQTVVSDGSWKASYGPIQFGDLLLGSGYDARLERPGWDTTNFNDSSWSPVLTGLSATAGGYTNVTSLVSSLVSNNQLNLVADNTTMGGDPAYGIAKTLQVNFTLGGTNQILSFAENATVQIGDGVHALNIISAYYGNAAAFPGLGGMAIQAAVTEPSRPMETLPAVNLTEPKPGLYTFDLGQNMVGWVRLHISGSVGDRITVRHGEMLNPDGTVYTANLRGANATDFYTFGTNSTITYEPRFTFHGFRYVEIRGLTVPPTLSSVTGIVVHSAMPQTGDFQSSSPLLNQLFSNIIWGQKGNYLEVPTDCPQRDERLGWSGDTEFFVPTAAYNFDVQSFFRRHMITFCEDSQNADGSYANVAPDLGAGGGAAAWEDAGWICPYTIYRDYGDTNIIADHYASFQKLGQFLAAHASNYVISSLPGDFGDWVNLGGGASGKVIDTAFYAYYAQAMSEMAAAIGKNADAAGYAALHNNIAAAFAGFFNADGSFTDGSSQTGYALAFTLGLVPDALRSAVVGKFADSISAFGNHLATGFVGTPRLLPALHLAGRDDLAYALLLQDTYPSWLYQVKLGATTMWERWDGWTPGGGFQTIGMNSFNHYAFGAVGEYMYAEVGGITPASPGYKAIRIQPVPGDGLTWANTSFASVRGLISTAWTNADGIFKLNTVIPPNTTAQIFVPTTNAASVTESGVPAASADGVTYLGATNNYAVFSVGSGHYQWSSAYGIVAPPGPIITTTNQTGLSVPFTPGWSLVTNGSLIAGKIPASTAGNFNQESQFGNRSINSLTDGGSLTINTGGSPTTTSANYVTGGNAGGTSVVYTLTGSTNGYDLTNIVVYGGWGDNGRDQQAYTIYYSTVAAPGNFVQLATVNFNPSIAGGIPSATRVSLTYSTGVLASNVAAVKFDFSTPASENGFCGYAEITVFGNASPSAFTAPTLVTNTQPSLAGMCVGDQVAFSAAFASAQPINFQWQKISGEATNDLPGETGSTLRLNNLQLADTASYRLVASNGLGVAASSPASLMVRSPPAPVNNVVVLTANQAGLGGNTFYPSWTMVTNGSLIAGKSPDTATGDFSLELAGQRDVNSLTTVHDLGLTQISGDAGFPITTTPDYVTCGNNASAGSSLAYSLPASAEGYDLTNITVYGGWADNGRDQQAYTVSCATVGAPSVYAPLASVNFNPSIPGGVQSATRVALRPATGTLASNVVSVKFDFTSPASENGYCGYAGISVFGSIHLPPVVPMNVSAGMFSADMLAINVGNLVPGRTYEIQSTTNLASEVWTAETNFTATENFASITNSMSGAGQKYYRVFGY